MTSFESERLPQPYSYADETVLEDATGYINAGGRGTRLNPLFEPDPEFGIAKALLEVGVPPIRLVDHHVAVLGQTTLRNTVVGAGDLEGVAAHIEATYAEDQAVTVVRAKRQYGTAGDLILAIREQPELFGNQTVISNVDTILDLDFDDFVKFHRNAGAALSIALTRNKGVPNEDAFHVDSRGMVVYSAEATTNPLRLENALELTAHKGSSTGAVVLDTDFIRDIDWEPARGQLSLYRDVMGAALTDRAVASYDNGHGFFVDVGTVQTWIASGQTGMLQPYLRYPMDSTNLSYGGQR